MATDLRVYMEGRALRWVLVSGCTFFFVKWEKDLVD
jgi:hypothetical protein